MIYLDIFQAKLFSIRSEQQHTVTKDCYFIPFSGLKYSIENERRRDKRERERIEMKIRF